MANKLQRYNAKQLHAIEILAIPGRMGLTLKEVAAEVGCDESTLHRWRKEDHFYEAVRMSAIRQIGDKYPDLIKAGYDMVIRDGNAAALRTMLDLHGDLAPQKIEVTQTGGDSVEDVRKRVEEMRNAQIVRTVIDEDEDE